MVCIALHVDMSKESEVTDSKGDEEDKEDEEGVQGNEQKIKEVDVEEEKEGKENEESRRGFHTSWGNSTKTNLSACGNRFLTIGTITCP